MVQEQKSYRQKTNEGWKTSPPPVLIGLIMSTSSNFKTRSDQLSAGAVIIFNLPQIASVVNKSNKQLRYVAIFVIIVE